jgi:DNA (cytosine-5)-methyltransferase 1
MSRDFTFYEFFAGGGMARLGLGERWRCLFANDFDPIKADAYRANFSDAKDHFHEGDVWSLTTDDLLDQVDLAWASSPCQDFSLAGSRAGLAGTRSSAFFGFWTLVQALNKLGRAPRAIVIENVVGLLTSHDGQDFTSLCKALSEEGYRFGAVEIDAARFVPQSRPRVFVVATRTTVPSALDGLEAVVPHHSKRIVAAYERLPKAVRRGWVWWRLPYPLGHNQTIDTVLESDAGRVWFAESKIDHLTSLLNERHSEKLIEARKRGHRVVGTLFRRMRVEEGEKKQRAELRFDGVAGCLRTPGGGSSKQVVVVIDGGKTQARDMTGREAAKLMGLPDSYHLPDRKSSALKICGDGVVVPVVAWLRRELLESLAEAGVEEIDGREDGRRARA